MFYTMHVEASGFQSSVWTSVGPAELNLEAFPYNMVKGMLRRWHVGSTKLPPPAQAETVTPGTSKTRWNSVLHLKQPFRTNTILDKDLEPDIAPFQSCSELKARVLVDGAGP